jgi:hypothetical protein
MLPAALFMPLGKQKREVLLLLDENGMEHAAIEDSLLIHALVHQGYSVLLFDVPGIGSLGPGYLRGDAYINNTSFNQWFAGIHTDRSIVAMRAEDIIRVVQFLKSDFPGLERISAISSGPVGSEILHAAVFDRTIDKVCLIRPFLSFMDIALTWDYLPAFIHSTVAGAVNEYDLPDLMAALSPRKLLILDPLAADGRPAGEKERSCYLSYPRIVFTQKGVPGHFSHAVSEDSIPVYEQVINWLK